MARTPFDYVAAFDFATPAYDSSIYLRDLILRKPLNLEFEVSDLKQEWNSIHLGYFDNLDTLLGCLVLKPISSTTWKMRQVAVFDDRQGEGIGDQLIQAAEYLCRKKRVTTISLHARQTATEFYKKRGYTIDSELFMEVGIPHYAMSKNL